MSDIASYRTLHQNIGENPDLDCVYHNGNTVILLQTGVVPNSSALRDDWTIPVLMIVSLTTEAR